MTNNVLIHGIRELSEGSYEVDVEWEVVGLGVPGLRDSRGRQWLQVPMIDGIYKPEFGLVLDHTNGFLLRVSWHVRAKLLRGEPVAFPVDARDPKSMPWIAKRHHDTGFLRARSGDLYQEVDSRMTRCQCRGCDRWLKDDDREVIGRCDQGCCDRVKCKKCGYVTRVEWPD